MKKVMSSAGVSAPKHLVRHRINLVNKLTAAKEPMADGLDELINVDGKWHARPGQDYQVLRCYLLLTCFDILGQLTTEWADFYSWLNQKADSKPHTAAPATPGSEITDLYHSYNQASAARDNFYHFINTVISTQRRQELLANTSITKKDKQTDAELFYTATDDEKLKLLFDIRNAYLHTGTPVPAPGSSGAGLATPKEDTGGPDDFYITVRWYPKLFIEILEEELNKEG